MKGGENRKIRKWGPFVNSAPGSPRSRRRAPKTPQRLGARAGGGSSLARSGAPRHSHAPHELFPLTRSQPPTPGPGSSAPAARPRPRPRITGLPRAPRGLFIVSLPPTPPSLPSAPPPATPALVCASTSRPFCSSLLEAFASQSRAEWAVVLGEVGVILRVSGSFAVVDRPRSACASAAIT
jgi:hypothetical protein